ncbi:unnamed protein product [Closterium sp. Yama58-4]|nr:unnamed protein product [Closterium sp. Yama58-4]
MPSPHPPLHAMPSSSPPSPSPTPAAPISAAPTMRACVLTRAGRQEHDDSHAHMGAAPDGGAPRCCHRCQCASVARTNCSASHLLKSQIVNERVSSFFVKLRSAFQCGSALLCADEYDGAFLELTPGIAVVTNVEWEHVDLFHSEAAVRTAFSRFASRIKQGGVLVACGDNAGSRALVTHLRARHGTDTTASAPRAATAATAGPAASTSPQTGSGGSHRSDSAAGAGASGATARAAWLDVEEEQRTAVTYGLDEGNDWRAIMLAPNQAGGTDYVTVFAGRPMARVSLQLPGVHNVLNSLAF